MVNIGESREELTEAPRPSSSTITVGALRVNRRVAVVFASVLVSAAVAVAVLAVSFSPQQQQEYQQPLQQQPQQKSQQVNLETIHHTLHPRSLPPTTPPLQPLPPTPLPSVKISASTRNNRAYRLPTALRPIHYLVQLQPFIDGNFSIIGHVEIDFEVLEATPNVTLNILFIVTRNDTVKVSSFGDPSSTLSITQHLYHHEDMTYTAVLSESLMAGQNYTLSMDFEGYLSDLLGGFYRSSYTDGDGNTKFLAVTNFEPSFARSAFPCFDEPAMKATFDLQLARDNATKSSISNMPLDRTVAVDGQDGWVWDIYQTTVPMSTYLVACVVSDFTYRQSDDNHVRFRVWAREEAISQADYALQYGPECLTYYEEYFNVSFPLPKQDMIAIPDFHANAMENWGLITFRETALLLDPEVSSASNKAQVAKLVAHELAHQWFGNLVTLKWWNDLWLNEGFATFVSYLGTHHLEPTWRYPEGFVNMELQYVMGLDSLESSHPISVEVSAMEELVDLFDDISYSKGASIIRMIFFFLTEENFKKGITSYLNEFKYGNAEQDDLWNSLTEAVAGTNLLPEGATVKTIMDTWTLQMGFPVVKVVRGADGTTATVTQERFLQVKSPNSTDTNDYSWWVPLTYTTADELDFTDTVPKQWMADTQKQVTISGLPASDKWVIFNVQESGYYKVNYDDENWNLLTAQLEENHTVINVVNRAQLMDDALDLAAAGQLSYDAALSLNSYLDKETEYFPWESALDNLGYLEKMFTRSGGYGDLRRYLLSLLEPLYQSVGFEEGADDELLGHYKRTLALSWACNLGYKDCVDNSVSKYQAWMTNGTVVSPNLRSTVYCTGIAEGGEEAWDFGWLQYLETNAGSEKEKLLTALGCAKELWILSRYLNMAFTEGSGIKKQDAPRVFSAVSSNDIGRDLAWNYFRNQWQTIADYFGSFALLGDLVTTVSSEFNTQEEKHQLELFKEQYADQPFTAIRAIDQAIERVGNNIDWMNANYDTIVQWLQNHLNPSKST